MSQPSQSKPALDNSFSAFIAGLTIGIAGVLLLGTEEGRKISKKVVSSIPKDITNLFSTPDKKQSSSLPQITPSPQNIPFSGSEAPPPPPPPLPPKPFGKPVASFFSSNGRSLK